MKHTALLALPLLCIPIVAIALTEGPYTFTVSGGAATITDFDASYSGPLSIANTLGSYPVTSIGPVAFMDCTNITSVLMPNSVTNIADYAFAYCTRLTDLAIGSNVTAIAQYAFGYCSSLTNLVIGPGLAAIGEQAFYYCTGLTHVLIPDNVKTVGESAFGHCHGLISIIFGSGVTTVDDAVFFQSANLRRVYFTTNAPVLGSALFYGADDASVYYLPNTTGWGSSVSGRPAKLWNPTFTAATLTAGAISCTVTGTPEIPLEVQASSDLLAGPWLPLQTTNLATGALDVHDPASTNFASRFYRITGP